MPQTTSFIEHSRNITQHFLQSVVAVDDNMEFKPRKNEVNTDELVEPEEDSLGLGEMDLTESTEEIAPLNHKLYYQDLSLEFATKGIVCGGFSPTENTPLSLDAIVNTSKNADITILDWQMQIAGEDGKLATDTIKKIAENDITEGGRTRLICIYTAENALTTAQTLTTAIEVLCPTLTGLTISFSKSELSHWKIEIVNKEKQEVELCSFLINSFTTLTAGLLSNAALSSIASIRDNTHNLLHKFNKTLDPAYLSHVLGLISSPDMREQAHDVAFDYAVDLISEELKSGLQISKTVKDSLSKDILASWPTYVNPKAKIKIFRMQLGSEPFVEFNNVIMKKLLCATQEQTLIDILQEDIKMKTVDNISPLNRFKKKAIQLTVGSSDNTPLLDLCSLENTRRHVLTLGSHTPVMKQGTILKNTADSNYYICIQPVCDSVRLSGEVSFSFMKIRITSSDFTHVIRSATGYLKLNISPVPKNITTFSFTANPKLKIICADKNENGIHVFTKDHVTPKHTVIFEWCGELKQAVSQSIVNGLAAQLSRVGLDSFEWLRQKQK